MSSAAKETETPRGPGRPRNPRPATLAGAIGERVEDLRKRRGWTANDLADASGVGQGTVLAIERGQTSPTVDTVAAIAAGLETTPTKLLKGVSGWA